MDGYTSHGHGELQETQVTFIFARMQTCGNLRIEGKRNLESKSSNCAYLTFAWLVVHDSAIIFAPSWSLPQISSITRANARFAAVGHSTIQHAFFDCPGLPARPALTPV